MFPDGCVPADKNHGAGGLESVGHRRDSVGYAGAGGNDSHTGLAGNLGPSFRGVARHLLMTEVYNPDAFVDTPFVQVVDMPTVEGEDIFDPFLLEGFCKEMSTVYFCHSASRYDFALGIFREAST